jgi:hypothetical protein
MPGVLKIVHTVTTTDVSPDLGEFFTSSYTNYK